MGTTSMQDLAAGSRKSTYPAKSHWGIPPASVSSPTKIHGDLRIVLITVYRTKICMHEFKKKPPIIIFIICIGI